MAKSKNTQQTGTLQAAAGNIGEQAAHSADVHASSMMDRAGDTLGQVARAIRDAGQGLREERPEIADVANTAAERVEEAGQYLHEHTASEVLAAAQDVARRQPALVVGGGLVLGLALGRLLRSTQDAGQGGRSWDDASQGYGRSYGLAADADRRYDVGSGYGAGTAGAGYGTGYGSGEGGYGAYGSAGVSAAAMGGSQHDRFDDTGFATGSGAGSPLDATTGMSGGSGLDDDIRGGTLDPVAGADIDRTDYDPAMRTVETGDEALDDLGTHGGVTPDSTLDDETLRS